MCIRDREYTIGVLVQSNFGKTQDLTVAGVPVGRQICTKIQNSAKEDKGSIMAVSYTHLLPDGGNYIGIECENFTGNMELNIE